MPINPSIAERRAFPRPDTFDVNESDDLAVYDGGQRPTMALVGRLLIASIFLMSGISKLTDLPGTVAHMTEAGIPYAQTLATVAGIAEVMGALSLIAGLLTRVGSAGLILFMIPATLIFHAFWNFEGKERMPQMLNFMKNLAIIGGLAGFVAFGAGRFSLDHKLRRSRR